MTPFQIIEQAALATGPDVQIRIESLRFLASYNWTNADEPTIFVPGAPALWTSPNLPAEIPKDDGKAFLDENSNRILAPSFAPFFASLLIMQPSYSLHSVSLVSDRNSLRKLLDFASGHPKRNWRMEVELVNQTLFLTRWEENDVQIITGSIDSGYGHEFERAFLKFGAGLEDSSAHHRIVEYDIGDMKWVVRFEADGYLGQDYGDILLASESCQSDSDVNAMIEKLSLENDLGSKTSCGVTVIHRGQLVPQGSIIEVKCKSTRQRGAQLGKHIPQCWLAQTEYMLVGRHTDGLVERVNTVEMTENFDDWETKNNTQLRLLVSLIKQIKEVSGQVNGGKCCLVCAYKENPRVLRVFGSNDNRLLLTDEVKKRYWEGSLNNATG